MGQVLAVLPASGGVGATLLAAATATRAAAALRSVAAVDLDAHGAGLDVAFGAEQVPGWRWEDLREVAGLVDGAALRRRLLHVDGVAVLSMSRAWRPPAPGWLTVVPDVVLGLRAAHDLVVVDAPREDAVLEVLAGFADACVVVVGSRIGQLAAAAVLLPRVRCLGVQPWVVLRGGHADLEDLVLDELDVAVVDRLRDDPRTAADLEAGVPAGSRGRGPVVEVADRILLRLRGTGTAPAGSTTRAGLAGSGAAWGGWRG